MRRIVVASLLGLVLMGHGCSGAEDHPFISVVTGYSEDWQGSVPAEEKSTSTYLSKAKRDLLLVEGRTEDDCVKFGDSVLAYEGLNEPQVTELIRAHTAEWKLDGVVRDLAAVREPAGKGYQHICERWGFTYVSEVMSDTEMRYLIWDADGKFHIGEVFDAEGVAHLTPLVDEWYSLIEVPVTAENGQIGWTYYRLDGKTGVIALLEDCKEEGGADAAANTVSLACGPRYSP